MRARGTESYEDRLMLGWHWMIDARGCAVEQLRHPGALEEALAGVPDGLGLTRIGAPQVFEQRERGELIRAGVALIAESHFSLHLRPDLGSLHADLFSCARFDPAKALALLRGHFEFTDFEERMLTRGGGA